MMKNLYSVLVSCKIDCEEIKVTVLSHFLLTRYRLIHYAEYLVEFIRNNGVVILIGPVNVSRELFDDNKNMECHRPTAVLAVLCNS